MLGLKKKNTATLYDQCDNLFADNMRLVNTDEPCCDGTLLLASPDRRTMYKLVCYREYDYAIWLADERDNAISRMHLDGRFESRGGGLSQRDAERVLATYTPVANC